MYIVIIVRKVIHIRLQLKYTDNKARKSDIIYLCTEIFALILVYVMGVYEFLS